MLRTAYRRITYNTVTAIAGSLTGRATGSRLHYRVPLELNSLIVFSTKGRQ
jgi:hypothetical protein